MDNKRNIENSIMAFATYKPRPGKENELLEIVSRHSAVLKDLELISGKDTYLARSEDGTIIEVFEWTSVKSVDTAHQHPAVVDIWEKMSLVADFVPMSTLPEAKKPFPGFSMLNT